MAAVPATHSTSLFPRMQVAPVREAPALPEFSSRRLLQGGREVLIHHGGQTYRLRHTRNDKLILTK